MKPEIRTSRKILTAGELMKYLSMVPEEYSVNVMCGKKKSLIGILVISEGEVNIRPRKRTLKDWIRKWK